MDSLAPTYLCIYFSTPIYLHLTNTRKMPVKMQIPASMISRILQMHMK